MVIEEDDAPGTEPAHRREALLAPFPEFIKSVVVIKLLLLGAGSPTLEIAAMQAEIEQIGIGDDVKGGEEVGQGRGVDADQGDAPLLQAGKDAVVRPGAVTEFDGQRGRGWRASKRCAR